MKPGRTTSRIHAGRRSTSGARIRTVLGPRANELTPEDLAQLEAAVASLCDASNCHVRVLNAALDQALTSLRKPPTLSASPHGRLIPSFARTCSPFASFSRRQR